MQQPLIAVVEDEEALREAVAEYLSGRGFQVTPCADASEYRTLVESQAVDVALLDIAMPGEDGLSLARWIRSKGPRPGIIFATAAGMTVDRIVGLEIGADDYVVKPYDLRELLARIKSVLRRLADQPATAPAAAAPVRANRVVSVGPMVLDLDSRRLAARDGQTVDLTAMEVDLLAALATRPNRILTRAQLLELAHGRSAGESDRSIDIRITRLRKKIETNPDSPQLIRTVRGEGYMFVPDQA